MKLLSIIIPVYNEEQFVGQLLQKVYEVNLEWVGYSKELIVVNDGSKDTSEQIIKKFIEQHPDLNCKYIFQERQKDGSNSKWAALKNWFGHATGDLYIIQDADLEYDPSDYIALIEKIEKNNLDFVYGSRTTGYLKFWAKYSTFGFLLGGLLLSAIVSILGFTLVTDEPTCYKLYKSTLKDHLLRIKENSFDREPAITMLLLKKGYRYGEVPIHYYPRTITTGKKIKLMDGRDAIKTLFKYRFN